MIGGPGLRLQLDEDITRQRVKPGTLRRILPYAKGYRRTLTFLLVATAIDSAATAGSPLLLGLIIDDGIISHRLAVLIELTVTIGVLAVVDALAIYVATWCSARAGQGLIFSLRTQVFKHVQQQPLAFFTRSQTGSLVSRLNSDVIGGAAPTWCPDSTTRNREPCGSADMVFAI